MAHALLTTPTSTAPEPSTARWSPMGHLWIAGLLLIIGVAGLLGWRRRTADVGEGFACGIGRIESMEIDITARADGRIKDFLVNGRDYVAVGQVIAHVDPAALAAEQSSAARGHPHRHRHRVDPEASAPERARSWAGSLLVVLAVIGLVFFALGLARFRSRIDGGPSRPQRR